MLRYRYTIEAPTNDEHGDPYHPIKTVFNREEAKMECPINGFNYCHVCLEEKRVERDELGSYTRWEALSSGSLEPDELHSNKPLEDFLYLLN